MGKRFVKLQVWEVINEQIDRSNIKRYRWRAVFGTSLTKYILKLKFKGHTALETYQVILRHPKLQEVFRVYPDQKEKMISNIKISVCARFGENNSALKVMEEKE